MFPLRTTSSASPLTCFKATVNSKRKDKRIKQKQDFSLILSVSTTIEMMHKDLKALLH